MTMVMVKLRAIMMMTMVKVTATMMVVAMSQIL